LFHLPFGSFDLVLLPPDEPAGRCEEDEDPGDHPIAIGFEKIAQLVATQILVDFADESFT
jgi:hypothetical protein